MSLYNNVLAPVTCPACGTHSEILFFIFEGFGQLSIRKYKLGEKVAWAKFNSVRKGGRPPGGTVTSTAWGECPTCDAELDAEVVVVEHVVSGVNVRLRPALDAKEAAVSEVREALSEYMKRRCPPGSHLWMFYEPEFESPAVTRVREDGTAEWVPVLIEGGQPDLPFAVHPSVLEYLTSFWFLACGGKWRGEGVQLFAVYGPLAWVKYAEQFAAYAVDDGDDFAPIGLDVRSSCSLAVSRATGEVMMLDGDTGIRTLYADSLAQLIAGFTA
jgi:hypothetical protein